VPKIKDFIDNPGSGDVKITDKKEYDTGHDGKNTQIYPAQCTGYSHVLDLLYRLNKNQVAMPLESLFVMFLISHMKLKKGLPDTDYQAIGS